MDNNFFGNLFSPKKTSGKETASLSLPVLYPAPKFRGLENWINTPPGEGRYQMTESAIRQLLKNS